MHPTDLELIRFARMPDGERDLRDPVALHLVGCDDCREELAIMVEWLANTDVRDMSDPARSRFEDTVIRLFRQRTTVIAFAPFAMPETASHPHSLAADGVTPPAAGLQHRATLYSEDPEVILRVMHDPKTLRDVLQLTADDPALTSHVYIRLTDPPMEFFTNERGIAEAPARSLEDPSTRSWRLQLPDASFMLKPLEQSTAARETVIDLPDGDSVAITVLPDSKGLSLRVRPMRIHGHETIERVRVVVCQSGGRWQAVDTRTPGECVAANLSSDSPIEIRLFVIE